MLEHAAATLQLDERADPPTRRWGRERGLNVARGTADRRSRLPAFKYRLPSLSKIFLTPVERAYRIRTGESGDSALT